jgi:hypothetical protein
MTTPTLDPATIDAAADRALGYLSGAAISAMVYLGDQLGLYRVLRDAGRVTSTELASRSRLDERWVREWLHSQASAGLVEHGPEGVFGLSAETAVVLADEGHPAFVGGGFALLFPLLQRWDRLFDSFRCGRGVPYNDLGLEHAIGESRFSSPWMRANLVPIILPGLEDVVPRL